MKKKEEMSLFGHLDELRKRLTVIVVATLAVSAFLFTKADMVMDYFLAINPGMELVFITPSELLVVYVQLSLIMALIVCAPINIYEVWAFVEKGLYKKEKIYILLTLIFGTIFFVAGVAFCYFMVLPTTLKFFMRIAIEDISSMISIKSYVSFINTMLLCFGAVFEMPVLVFLLSKLEILKPQFLKANRGLFIIAIFILAAVITPPDVVSQLMLAVPMIMLFQLSTFVCVVVDKTNRKKHSDDETYDDVSEKSAAAAD
ncbi:MAG: twin-arginine translocase subunit TatC [Oscillospiraceae bacterium]|nr:twin-arginine translocase subunit TatC [Oscillospiraceae bacterium]